MLLEVRAVRERLPLSIPEGNLNFVRVQSGLEWSPLQLFTGEFVSRQPKRGFWYDFIRWIEPFDGIDYGILTNLGELLVVHHGLVTNPEIEEIIRYQSREKTITLLQKRVPHKKVVGSLEELKR